MVYGYGNLQNALMQNSNLNYKALAVTAGGRDIYGITLGKTKPEILVFGAIHAREYITAKLITELCNNYTGSIGILAVPMVNPDGVELTLNGLQSVANEQLKKQVLTANGLSQNFGLWKANINCVDLNVNFDAGFGKGLGNVFVKAPQGYVGTHPFSEVETQLLRDLTKKHNFKIVLCYHAKGQVIYYGYNKKYAYPKIATKISQATTYPLLNAFNSHGGYKDWYTTQNINGIALTVEVGSEGANFPLSAAEYNLMLSQNRNIFEICAQEVGGIKP